MTDHLTGERNRTGRGARRRHSGLDHRACRHDGASADERGIPALRYSGLRSKVLMRDLAGLCGICGMPTHTTLTRVHNVAGSPPVAAPMEVGDERGVEYCGEIGRIYLTFDMYSPNRLAWAHRRETGSLGTAPTATQSLQCSHSGTTRGFPPFSRCFLGNCTALGRAAEEVRRVRGEVAADVRVIVSRARFPGPGCAVASASRDTAPAEGGRQIGLQRGPMLSPSPAVVVRARVGHPGYPA